MLSVVAAILTGFPIQTVEWTFQPLSSKERIATLSA